jgi:formate hydrogenlyase subunit 3/multisubunit Na+/H+ antiporter MnhD subunit
MTALTIATFACPLLVAAALAARPARPSVTMIAPCAALPAFALAFAPVGTVVHARWALLGARFGVMDEVARGFLASSALVWFFAGWYARAYVGGSKHRGSFWFFFLVTMAANFGVVTACDAATFYVFFSLMTYAAYGLVVHERDAPAARAARTYVVMALGGEMLVLTGLFVLVRSSVDLRLEDVPSAVAVSPRRLLVSCLVFAGFGVKAGLVPLHLWLPLAHPVAPTPASAVLSATIIEAGLLGWLRFLPLGAVPNAEAATTLVCATGLVTALYGAAVGVVQSDPKTVLAYSSVSQMGFAVTALGVALAPAAAGAAKLAIVFFVAHHAVAKAALFLGEGVARDTGTGRWGRLVLVGLVLPALAIAGAPFTGGALAKIALADVVKAAPVAPSAMATLLSVAAIGSTLLMARFVWLAARRRADGPRSPSAGLWIPLALLFVAGTVLVSLFALRGPVPFEAAARPANVASAAWPVAAGVAIALAARHVLRRAGRALPGIPPGDVLAIVEPVVSGAAGRAAAGFHLARRARRLLVVRVRCRLRPLRRARRAFATLDRVENALMDDGAIGMLTVLLAGILVPLFVR